MAKPLSNEYASFYANYVAKANANSVNELISNYANNINNFISNLPNEKQNYAYAPNKWTVKDLLLHIIDTERIFVYRALRFSRKDTTPVAGFEEDFYAANAYASERTFESLKEEFLALRKSTDIFLQTLNENQLSQIGTANNNAITVNALCYIIFGHILHHIQILQERYL